MRVLIKWVSLDGKITSFQIWMGKYLIEEVTMGIYLNFSKGILMVDYKHLLDK